MCHMQIALDLINYNLQPVPIDYTKLPLEDSIQAGSQPHWGTIKVDVFKHVNKDVQKQKDYKQQTVILI